MSNIWIFREPRSGSTAFVNQITTCLNKKHFFVNHKNFSTIDINSDTIYSTHDFDLLESFGKFQEKPILIRCTRKDKIEHCLSNLLIKYIHSQIYDKDRIWNTTRDNSNITNMNIFSEAKPTIFTKNKVLEYLRFKQSMENYWNSYSCDYENTTVFYEDLCTTGVDIPVLGIKSLHILNDDSITVKLPEYKTKLCLNYALVKRWINEN